MGRIIWNDFKSMLKNPVVFIILFLGLVIGAFSLLVYYVTSSQSLRANEMSLNRLRVIESESFLNSSEQERLLELLEDGSLPAVHYVSFSNYDSDDYDLIGTYWYTDPISLDVGGNYITYNDRGKQIATVSLELADKKNVAMGDMFTARGRKFEIVGLLPPDYHNPVLYDSRRLPRGADYVAGTNLNRDEELLSRPDAAVIVPLDIFTQLNADSHYFHIAFMNDLSESDRTQIETLLQDKVGMDRFVDIEPFAQVDKTNRWAQAVLYFAAVFAGLINIIILFNYFFRQNRKKYITYKLYGATAKKIGTIILLEIFLFSLPAFAIGCMGAIPFIEKSGLIDIHMPYGLADMLILYIVFAILEVCICWRQIRKISHSTNLQLIQDYPKHRRVRKVADKTLSWKSSVVLSVLRGNESIICTLSLAFLALITAFSLSYAMTYVYDGNRYERYVNRYFPYDTSAIAPNEDTMFAASESFWNGIPLEEDEFYAKFLEAIHSLEGVRGIGTLESPRLGLQNTQNSEIYKIIELQEVNDDFIKYSPPPLESGNWEPFATYDPTDQSVPIPCVISPNLKDEYPLGSEFTMQVETLYGIREEEDGSYYDSDRLERSFVVVGIVSPNAYKFGSAMYPDTLRDITYYLRPYSTELLDAQANNRSAYHAYTPHIISGGEHISNWPALYLIYAKGDESEVIADWREQLARYAGVDSFHDCIQNFNEAFQSGGGNLYFMHATISATLLILGIGGYNIMFYARNKRRYGVLFICGMSWHSAIRATLAQNACAMLLPAAVGAVVGVYAAQGVRSFDNATITLSVLTGLGAVAAVYALTSVVIALSMRKARPKRLMTEDGGEV